MGKLIGIEFFAEGAALVSESIGFIVGQALIPIPYVGGFIGSMVITTACVGIYKASLGIYDAYCSVDEHKEKLAKVLFPAELLAEMGRQRNILKEIIGKHYKKWDEQFNLGFEENL